MNKPPEASRKPCLSQLSGTSPWRSLNSSSRAVPARGPFREATSSEGGGEEPREGGLKPRRSPYVSPFRRSLPASPNHRPRDKAWQARQDPPPPRACETELGKRTAARLQQPSLLWSCAGHTPALASPPRPLWVHQAPLAHSSKQERSCNQQRLNGLQGAWSPCDRCHLGSLSVSTGVVYLPCVPSPLMWTSPQPPVLPRERAPWGPWGLPVPLGRGCGDTDVSPSL